MCVCITTITSFLVQPPTKHVVQNWHFLTRTTFPQSPAAAMTRNLIGLYPPIVSDLRSTIDALADNGYDLVVTPIVNPQATRSFTDAALRERHTVFSRSDLILDANEWHQKTIARLTDSIDCDSPDGAFRRHSVQVLQQEMSFSEHLSNGSMLIRLRSGRSVNLARTMPRHIKSMGLVCTARCCKFEWSSIICLIIVMDRPAAGGGAHGRSEIAGPLAATTVGGNRW